MPYRRAVAMYTYNQAYKRINVKSSVLVYSFKIKRITYALDFKLSASYSSSCTNARSIYNAGAREA